MQMGQTRGMPANVSSLLADRGARVRSEKCAATSSLRVNLSTCRANCHGDSSGAVACDARRWSSASRSISILKSSIACTTAYVRELDSDGREQWTAVCEYTCSLAIRFKEAQFSLANACINTGAACNTLTKSGKNTVYVLGTTSVQYSVHKVLIVPCPSKTIG